MKKLGAGLVIGLFMISFVFALCRDSDGGKNFDKKGYTSDEYINYQDFCIAESDDKIQQYIAENYCLDDEADIVINECNYKCDNGRCVNKPLTRKIIDYFYSFSEIPDENIKNAVNYCVVKNSNIAIKKIGLNGGRVNPDEFYSVEGEKIMYGYLNGENTLISDDEIEDEIEEYLKLKISKCLEEEGLNEAVEVKKIDAEIKNTEVYLSSEIFIGENKINSRNFFPIKIRDIRKIANKIIKRESEYMDYSELSFLAEVGYPVIITPIANGKIVAITDQSVSMNNEPFVFRFAMRDNEELMSLKSKGFLNTLFDLFGIYEGYATGAYEGGVPKCDSAAAVYEPVPKCSQDGTRVEIFYKGGCSEDDRGDTPYTFFDCSSGKCETDENGFGRCVDEIPETPEPEEAVVDEIPETPEPEEAVTLKLTGCSYVSVDCSLSSLSRNGLIIRPNDNGGYSVFGDYYPITNNPEQLSTIGILKSPVNNPVFYELSEYIGDETTYCSGGCVSVKELGDYDFSSINLLAMDHNKKSKVITGNVILQGGALLKPGIRTAIEIVSKNSAFPALKDAVTKRFSKEVLVAFEKTIAGATLQQSEINLLNSVSQKCLNDLASDIGAVSGLPEFFTEEGGGIIGTGGESCISPEELANRFTKLYEIPELPPSVRSLIFSRTDSSGEVCPEIEVEESGAPDLDCPESIQTPGSFLADTNIMMSDGSYKEIKDIVIGDRVMAYDIFSNKPEIAPVTYTFNYPETSYRIIEYEVVE